MVMFKICIKTANRDVYDLIRRREDQVIRHVQDLMSQFLTLYGNSFVESLTQWRTSLIPVLRNDTAEYLAIYGMTHMKSFCKATGFFGNLATFLNRDMGRFLPFEVEDNFGLGEVFDVPSPDNQVDFAERISVFDIIDNELRGTLDEFLCRYAGGELKEKRKEPSIKIAKAVKGESGSARYDVNLDEDGEDVEKVLLLWAEMEEKMWDLQTSWDGEKPGK
ncbi:hypothetical protein AgCh_035329 [Apium graveolens]